MSTADHPDPGAAVAELVGALRAEIHDVAGDVRRSVTAALEDGRGAVESRLAALEDALEATSERIEALSRDSAGLTTARLVTLQAGVEALAERVESLAGSVEQRDRVAKAARARPVKVAPPPERRARVDSMPEARSPEVALEAAAPRPPGPEQAPQQAAVVRRFFRRRRP